MQCEIGVYGLGVMGKSIAQNILNHGFATAVYSKEENERQQFSGEQYEEKCVICTSEKELVQALRTPRKIFLMITAGAPVDSVIESLLPMLEPEDVIFDGGNSYYKDTQRRCEFCESRGIHYVGTGVSGGQKGALYGPSIMPGGSLKGYLAGEKILTSIAARAGEVPCCAYIGKGGSGHYVKMVHNGIEYAILELIGEAYMIMLHGLDLAHEEILEIFRSWKKHGVDFYLLEISILVMERYEDDGTPLIDRILDVAGQKGTGKWTIIESIERGVYTPGIYEAVLARDFSGKKEMRTRGVQCLQAVGTKMQMPDVEEVLGEAFLLSAALAYCQGTELIKKASDDYDWNIHMEMLADVWSEGCIIRSSLLGDIKAAVENGDEDSLLFSEAYAKFRRMEPSLRKVVTKAESAGIACTGFSAALHYYDYHRTEDMPVRFVQALRDCFGAHSYRRNDMPGHFHTEW